MHVEITESHEARGRRITVRRALPRRGRRTVGAWCFADHMGPASRRPRARPGRGPAPAHRTADGHLAGGRARRCTSDSLGSEQVITPGQLNLMTAGPRRRRTPRRRPAVPRDRCTASSCGSRSRTRPATATPAFEHHAELPQVELDGGVATVLVGELDRRAQSRPGTTPRSSASSSTCGSVRPSRCAPTSSTRWSSSRARSRWTAGGRARPARLPRPGRRRADARGRAMPRA